MGFGRVRWVYEFDVFLGRSEVDLVRTWEVCFGIRISFLLGPVGGGFGSSLSNNIK